MLAVEHYMKYKGEPVTLCRPKRPQPILKDTITEAEMNRLIVAAGPCIRKRLLITILAYSGIRCVELSSLKRKDVDLGKNEITVRFGKNKTDRITHISPECTDTLVEYLKSYLL
jgi:integrase